METQARPVQHTHTRTVAVATAVATAVTKASTATATATNGNIHSTVGISERNFDCTIAITAAAC